MRSCTSRIFAAGPASTGSSVCISVGCSSAGSVGSAYSTMKNTYNMLRLKMPFSWGNVVARQHIPHLSLRRRLIPCFCTTYHGLLVSMFQWERFSWSRYAWKRALADCTLQWQFMECACYFMRLFRTPRNNEAASSTCFRSFCATGNSATANSATLRWSLRLGSAPGELSSNDRWCLFFSWNFFKFFYFQIFLYSRTLPLPFTNFNF